MIEVEGRSVEADEWALMLAWSVLASWRDVRLAAGQHLTLVKKKRRWKDKSRICRNKSRQKKVIL